MCTDCAPPLLTQQEMVEEFYVKAKHEPTLPLARALLLEELGELSDALYEAETRYRSIEFTTIEERVAVIKEMADVIYTLYGFARKFGVDLDEAVRRVHASNMSKFNTDGTVSMNAEGKIIKGLNYKEPDLSDL